MSRNTRLPPKKDVALALLENSTLFLHLDPRHDEVKVPPWFKRQPQLVLQVGLNMPVPIPDLRVDDDGVSCTLSFNRSPHFCHVPWKAIYALVGEDGRGMVWPDDVPPEVAAQVQPTPEAKPKPRLHAVPSEGTPTEPAPPELAVTPAPAPAPERVPAASVAATDKKRARKKSAKGRVPSPAKGDRGARPALAPVENRPRSKQESSKEGGDGQKKKRELPPYLRVVK